MGGCTPSRTRALAGALEAKSDFPTTAPVNCAFPQGSSQQDTGSAGSESKVYVTCVQKANILFSLSSQETERLNPLKIVRSMNSRRIKINFNEIC